MNNRAYSIAELEQLTGLPRRTIHFYVQKGLVPSPSAKGGPAKYPEESLLHLQMIRVLQGSHLKLDGIREALDAMDLDQMRQLVSNAESTHKTWDQQTVDAWVTPPAPVQSGSKARNFSFARLATVPEPSQGDQNMLGSIKRKQTQGERWDRYQVADGIELNIREEISDKAQVLIKALQRELKQGGHTGGAR